MKRGRGEEREVEKGEKQGEGGVEGEGGVKRGRGEEREVEKGGHTHLQK